MVSALRSLRALERCMWLLIRMWIQASDGYGMVSVSVTRSIIDSAMVKREIGSLRLMLRREPEAVPLNEDVHIYI